MRMTRAIIIAGVLAAGLLPLAAPAMAKTAPKKSPAAAKTQTAKETAKAATDDPDGPVENIAPPSAANLEAVGWRFIDDPATGARLGLPSALVPKTSAARMGSRWTSGHGQIEIETFRLPEAALPALFDDEKKTRHRTVEHSALKPDSFVMSGLQGLKRFVVRAQASGSELRGVTILYDQATEGLMAPIAAAMADTFQGFPDPNAGPPPGLRRSVEYGTAIVVSDRGDVLASAQLTAQCQSITVPGFGHAERIASDADIALLRLYGARNLVPIATGGELAATDALTLVGIADPLTQSGAGGVSRAAAHLTAQSLDPVPKAGFSGAAAFDSDGRFAGVVSLKWLPAAATPKPAQVAANGPPAQTAAAGAPAPVALVSQAALVPADEVRAFLAARKIAPVIAINAADEHSILRVICVRK